MPSSKAFWLVLAVLTTVWAQAPGHQVLDEKAGMIPVRARVAPWPPTVGQAHFVVEVADGGPSLPARFDRSVRLLLDLPEEPSRKLVSTRLRSTGRERFEGDLVFPKNGRWRLRFVVGTRSGEFQMVSMIEVGQVAAPAAQAKPSPAGEPSPSPLAAASPSPTPALNAEGIEITPLAPPHVGLNRLRIAMPATDKVWVGVDLPEVCMAITPMQARRLDDGAFQADVRLAMPGAWRVTVHSGDRGKQVELVVPVPPRVPLNARLFWLSLAVLLPAGAWWAVRRRPLAPYLGSAALVLATFLAGAVIEKYWPPEPAMGMDMGSPDMGLGGLVAPLPVLDTKVSRLPFAVTRAFPGRVQAASESILTAARGGPVLELASPGVFVRRGDAVARVGSDVVRAPSAGVVVRRFLERGAAAPAGAPLLALGEVQRVRVQLRIPLADAAGVKPGNAVTVLSGAGTVQGRLESVAEVAEGDVLTAEALVPNVMSSRGMASAVKREPARMLRVGQDVTVRMVLADLPSVLCVPLEAVRNASTQPVVYVIEELAGQHVARRRLVSLGPANETHVQVLNGLREGETIVGVAEESLRDGALVTLGSPATGAYRRLLVPRDGGGGGLGH